MFFDIKRIIQSHPYIQPFFIKVRLIVKIVTSGSWGPVVSKDIGASKDSGNFLFIVGCGRSGNTLLRRLLMEKFDLYIPPETYVLPRQIEQYVFNSSLRWPEKVDVILSILENHPEFETFGVNSFAGFKQKAKEIPESERTFENLISAFYLWLGSVHGVDSRWVGDKTPLNTLNLGTIGKAFPNAKFIYLERDPVDVVQSYLDSGIYEKASEAALRWKTSLNAWSRFKKSKASSDVIEVRYEELVTSPDEILEAIGHQLSIPERGQSQAFESSALGDVGLRAHHANVNKSPMTSSIGKGREEISIDDLATVRTVLGRLPERRGYREI